jgi:hypothetical protein
MSHKNVRNLIAAAAIVALIVLVALIHSTGAPVKNLLYGGILMAIYVLLIISYVSRFALLLLGVFAVYKVLRERASLNNASR